MKNLNNNVIIKCYEFLPQDSKNIREEVFVNEQGFTEEFDTVDLRAYHFVAYTDSGEPLGTCRIFTENEPSVYFLGRLAVSKHARANGIGRALIIQAENKARELNAVELRLHSQCRAQAFYEKCGYLSYGEIELDEGCPHIWMKKVLINE